jgi:hypothetical protein
MYRAAAMYTACDTAAQRLALSPCVADVTVVSNSSFLMHGFVTATPLHVFGGGGRGVFWPSVGLLLVVVRCRLRKTVMHVSSRRILSAVRVACGGSTRKACVRT